MATTSRPKPPTAKWGAACASCSIAKAKCIRSDPDEAAKCDRCQRLYKDCSKKIHRPRKKRAPVVSRTTQLETKINDLVDYLKVSGDWKKASSDLELDSSYGTATVGTDTHTSPAGSLSDSFRSPTDSTWVVPPTYNSCGPASCICRADPEEAPPPPDTDEALLEIFKTQFTYIHPFVIIPDETTAAELNASRPFLMSAIRMVTSFRSLKSMRAQMYRIMVYLSDHLLIRSERSMDLLLGLIVVIGWYQFHCFMHAQLNNLLAMACTLCSELALNRDPAHHERTLLMMVKPPLIRPRTNEQRRAFAGVWFLSSAMSIGFARVEPLRYTYYLDECVKHLEECKEYPTDERLVLLVRIQHLTERITRLSSRDKSLDEMSNSPRAPLSAYMCAFELELDSFEASVPLHLRCDHLVMAYIKTAKLRLHEPPPLDKELIDGISASLASAHPGAGSPIDQLYQSANALRDWFDHWLTVPIELYHLQTTSIGSQLIYALTMLSRWAKLAAPRTMYGQHTPMPEDPSSKAWAYEQQQGPSNDTLHRSEKPCGDSNPDEPSASLSRSQDLSKLSDAVALLRSRLKEQPGLRIDIASILTSVYARFEQANDALQAMSHEDGKVRLNIWSMSAVKIKITQARLEKWAEMVATKTQALSHSDEKNLPSTSFQQDFGIYNQSELYGLDIPAMFAIEGTDVSLNSGDGDLWMTEVMGGVDPSMWFDGYVDWGQMVVNSSEEFQG